MLSKEPLPVRFDSTEIDGKMIWLIMRQVHSTFTVVGIKVKRRLTRIFS